MVTPGITFGAKSQRRAHLFDIFFEGSGGSRGMNSGNIAGGQDLSAPAPCRLKYIPLDLVLFSPPFNFN